MISAHSRLRIALEIESVSGGCDEADYGSDRVPQVLHDLPVALLLQDAALVVILELDGAGIVDRLDNLVFLDEVSRPSAIRTADLESAFCSLDWTYGGMLRAIDKQLPSLG